MRFMITFRIPMDKGNALAKDGKLGDTVQSILEDLKPEAAYFADIEGARGGYLVVNMGDASQIPAIVEPLFLGLGATLHAQPVFTPEDMPRAMEGVEQAAQKYGYGQLLGMRPGSLPVSAVLPALIHRPSEKVFFSDGR